MGDWFLRCPQKEMVYKTNIIESRDCWCFSIQQQFQNIVLTLQPGTPEKPFQPSSTCAPKCAKDSLCCIDPKEGTASCFAVKTCSQITPGGGAPNMTLPFKLAQFDVDSGSLIASPDLCTLESCPWSLESE